MTTAAFDAALKSGNPRVGIFFRLAIDPPFRMWLGIGDCQAGIDAADGAGAIYLGLGEVVGLPAFQQVLNGAADRIDIKLSGVSQRIIDTATMEADEVKGVPLNIGVGVFDEDWQLVGAPVWIKRLIVDYLSISGDGGGPDRPAMRTVSLSARTIFTARRRPGLAFFTDSDQQQAHPGDRFCENAVHYSRQVSKTWPRLSA
jgi:hypothetical protein